MKTKQKEKYLTTSRRKSVNEKQRQKPSVIYWINLWQVLFPLF